MEKKEWDVCVDDMRLERVSEYKCLGFVLDKLDTDEV